MSGAEQPEGDDAEDAAEDEGDAEWRPDGKEGAGKAESRQQCNGCQLPSPGGGVGNFHHVPVSA